MTTIRKEKRAIPGARRPNHPAYRLRAASPAADWWLLRFDGGCTNNGSEWATGKWGFHLLRGGVITVAVKSGITDADLVTNNVSEWQGAVNGIREAIAHAGEINGLLIEGDSNMILMQLAGKWAAKKPHLQVYRDTSLELLALLGKPWHARWIPREENAFCDSLT